MSTTHITEPTDCTCDSDGTDPRCIEHGIEDCQPGGAYWHRPEVRKHIDIQLAHNGR